MKELKKINLNRDGLLANRAIKKIIIKNGILASLCYIAFFFLMRLFGLLEVTELRFVNYALFGLIGYSALAEFRKQFNLNYIQDFGLAFLVGVVSFFLLAVFIYIYLRIDLSLTHFLESTSITGGKSDPSDLALLLFMEGAAMSAVITLCIMQLYKKTWDKE